MILIAAPGQGSQSPGFLSPWLELDGVRDLVGELGEAAGVDLIEHGTESDAETIKDTKVAQPLIVAAGIVAARALDIPATTAVAGHSVGEITAMAISGILSDSEAMSLVGVRGRAMAEAAGLVSTGMAAVLGGDAGELETKLEELGLHAANFNGAGQTVVAGETDALAALAENPPTKARVVPLQTAGAFHTRFMEPAVVQVRDFAGDIEPADPNLAIYSNRHGDRVASGQEFLDLVVEQISAPVRWDDCMESFARDGIAGMIELAPAGALAGLAKRGMRGVPVVAVKTPNELEAAQAMLKGETE